MYTIYGCAHIIHTHVTTIIQTANTQLIQNTEFGPWWSFALGWVTKTCRFLFLNNF